MREEEERIDFEEEVEGLVEEEKEGLVEEGKKEEGNKEENKEGKEVIENVMSNNSGAKSLGTATTTTTSMMINRDECCPTLLKIVVLKNGKKLEWKRDWKESLKEGGEEVQSLLLYAWPDSSLEEIALLVASKVPAGFIANHNVKFVFKAVHMEKFLQKTSFSADDRDRDNLVVKPSVSDIGFLYLNNQHTSNIKGGHPKTLFKSRFSLGDILEVSILTRAEALSESNKPFSSSSSFAAAQSNNSNSNAGKMKSDLRSSLKGARDRFAPYSRK